MVLHVCEVLWPVYHCAAGMRTSLYLLNVREAETQMNCVLCVQLETLQHRYSPPPAFDLEKKESHDLVSSQLFGSEPCLRPDKAESAPLITLHQRLTELTLDVTELGMVLKHFAVLSAIWADTPILYVHLCCPTLACLSTSSTSSDKAHMFSGVMDVLSHVGMKIVFPKNVHGAVRRCNWCMHIGASFNWSIFIPKSGCISGMSLVGRTSAAGLLHPADLLWFVHSLLYLPTCPVQGLVDS